MNYINNDKNLKEIKNLAYYNLDCIIRTHKVQFFFLINMIIAIVIQMIISLTINTTEQTKILNANYFQLSSRTN